MNYSEIMNIMKSLRKQHNMTQEQLAQLLYLDKSTINRWEKGVRNPNIDYIHKMCNIFDVSFNEILNKLYK